MYRFFIRGVVQGVGFRPYIYRKAKEFGLKGSVKNVGNGVEVLVDDKEFIGKLTDLPPLARISEYSVEKVRGSEIYGDFSILRSSESEGETLLPPDVFMCEDCHRELRKEGNRRHNYYFITCTNCGPRFSMIRDYPYDRPLTSMSEFEMCPSCRKEYTDPLDRRYHAQTIACKKCGPKLKLVRKGRNLSGSSDLETIRKAAEILKSGEIVAIKGVGGFHICSRTDEAAVGKVRTLLKREHKPFAIMVKDLERAREISRISEKESKLLQGYERPIVVLKKRDNSLESVSELDSIGIMLPYTALHYLLFDFLDEPLLFTSCNVSGEPVSTKEIMGDCFLTHEREIANRCDDSVLKVNGDKVFYLRRSRGFVPLPVKLPISVSDTIAVGAELSNAICTAKKMSCFLSQYVGNTSKLKTAQFLEETVDRFVRLTRLKPEIIACDAHPEYSSTLIAKKLSEKFRAELISIQHHKAHVASVAAEHDLTDYVGIAMDGMGFGDDGKIWGGEVFEVRNGVEFNRLGHLEEQPQLGGDSATIYPKKMLFGILGKFLDDKEISRLGLFPEKEANLYFRMLESGFNVPKTTSSGRVLDAASALLGFCDVRTYDGRPAMVLESKSTVPYELKPVYSVDGNDQKVLLTSPLFEFLLGNMGKDRRRLAATAQAYLAKGLLGIAKTKKRKRIAFSGGVAYNRMISGIMMENGALVNREIPCGDGGICYGQAYLANLIRKPEKRHD